MRFSKSKVEYASHQLSLYKGKCPHDCMYCFVEIYRKRKWKWACGDMRINAEARKMAHNCQSEGVSCLVVSFTGDPLPRISDPLEKARRLQYLITILTVLDDRRIPTKVLTKNADISRLAEWVSPFKHIQIGMSITTNYANSNEAIKWEPKSSLIYARIIALQTLKMKGFRTWISAEPILPKTDIHNYIMNLASCMPEEIWFGKGSYHSELENAVDWEELKVRIGEAAECFPLINFNIKKELKE